MTSVLKVDTIQSSGGTTGLTITSGGLILPKSVAFQVEASNLDQSVSADTNTVAQWETVQLDTGSYWDSTNHRYTPQVAGWYLFGGTFRFLTSAGQYIAAYLRKNGSGFTQVQLNSGSSSSDLHSNGGLPIPTTMVQMNGSSDYVDVSFAAENAVTLHDSPGTSSFFWGVLVHAT